MAGGVDGCPLLAVPFFILAGNLMNSAGITTRIFDFAIASVGWLRGGLGHVNVVASVIFAGMSGTAVADAGGLGTIEIKAMRDHRLFDGIFCRHHRGIIDDRSHHSAVAADGDLRKGAEASIGQLFAAGFIPGLLVLATSLMAGAPWAQERRPPSAAEEPPTACGAASGACWCRAVPDALMHAEASSSAA